MTVYNLNNKSHEAVLRDFMEVKMSKNFLDVWKQNQLKKIADYYSTQFDDVMLHEGTSPYDEPSEIPEQTKYVFRANKLIVKRTS